MAELNDSTVEYMRGYLAAMLDAEGHVSTDSVCVCSNTDPDIIKRVSSFLDSFCIGYYTKERKENTGFGKKKLWQILLSKKSECEKLYSVLGESTKGGKLFSWLHGDIRQRRLAQWRQQYRRNKAKDLVWCKKYNQKKANIKFAMRWFSAKNNVV